MENGKLTYADLPDIYNKLSADLPKEGIEKAPKEKTRKGYDTTGYGYQFHVNRMNEVLFGHYRVIHEMLQTENGKTSSSKTMYKKNCYMIIQLGNWIFENGEKQFEVLFEVDGYGGHDSLEESSALKGAYTNAFKKVSAMLGVGKKAFEGTLDDDLIGIEGQGRSDNNQPKQQQYKSQQTTQRKSNQQKQPAQSSKMTESTLNKIKDIWNATTLAPELINKQTDKYFKLPLNQLSEEQGQKLLEIFAAKKSESKEQKKNKYAALFAAGKEKNLSQDQVKQKVYAQFDITSLTELTDEDLTDVIRWIRTDDSVKQEIKRVS